jgi:plastocyanin domain-containing protein
VNRTSTFKVIGNIKFHVKVAFERGITKNNSETRVIILVVTDDVVNEDIF